MYPHTRTLRRSLALMLLAAAPLLAQTSDTAPVRRPDVAMTKVAQNWQWGEAGSGAMLKKLEDFQQGALMLRFQLISPTTMKSTDPAVAEIETALKELFKFPGYRLLSQAAVAVDYQPREAGSRLMPTSTSQLLGDENYEYRLTVQVDSMTAQWVRLSVNLVITQEKYTGADGKFYTNEIPGNGRAILSTKVTVSLGHTVVLGSTQPGGPVGRTDSGTLILVVRPDARK